MFIDVNTSATIPEPNQWCSHSIHSTESVPNQFLRSSSFRATSTRKGLKIWVSSVVCWLSACRSGSVISCTFLRWYRWFEVDDTNGSTWWQWIQSQPGTHHCEGLVYHGSRCMTCRHVFIYLDSILDSLGLMSTKLPSMVVGWMQTWRALGSPNSWQECCWLSFWGASCACGRNADSMFLLLFNASSTEAIMHGNTWWRALLLDASPCFVFSCE